MSDFYKTVLEELLYLEQALDEIRQIIREILDRPSPFDRAEQQKGIADE